MSPGVWGAEKKSVSPVSLRPDRQLILRAPMLSSAPKTRPKRANQSESNASSLMFACRASIAHFGLNCRAVAAATDALGFEMSGFRKRNWRLRLERSIVSRSTWKAEVTGECV